MGVGSGGTCTWTTELKAQRVVYRETILVHRIQTDLMIGRKKQIVLKKGSKLHRYIEPPQMFDLLRERPNNGIHMIFFLVQAVSPLNGTSKFLDVAASFRNLRGWLEELPLPPKKAGRSEVFVRRRQADERSDIVSHGKQVEGKKERWATRPPMKTTAIKETIELQCRKNPKKDTESYWKVIKHLRS